MTDQTDEQISTETTDVEDSGNIQHSTPAIEETTDKLDKMTMSFSIWPPTERTRNAVIKRLIETLSVKSVLSDRYGTISAEESADVARRIEEEAFNTAPTTPVPAGDDGIEILQSYSKEISKRMLDFVKSRSAESATVTTVKTEDKDGGVTAEDGIEGEENSSVET